ncbi:uncharacterized protein E0L32_008646 [Thyridium curvatum]|uniref:FAD dependent oxidoreductase domain-containing protein n=1 Tax=Thyridium curvatum TaxID=1093900 RepID=A0A507ASI6_9PEZI|nr:uncharacterized protein E0L32_008646 [Thyridium curvatum]TPX10427.1 hypothetical protein E0L32_008646 [Thyridium curvatum]
MEVQQPRNIVIVGGGIIGCTTAYFLTRHPKFDPALHKITLLEATAIASGASGKAGGLLGLWAYPAEIVPLSYRLHKELAAEHGGAERWGYRRLGCGSLSAVVKPSDIAALKASSVRTATPVKAPQVPSPGPPRTNGTGLVNGNGSANGSSTNGAAAATNGTMNGATAAPLPIQSKVEQGEEKKQWEKLPKQDVAASSLLHESPLPPDLDYIRSDLVEHYEEMGRRGATETAQVHPFMFTTAMAALAQDKGVDIRLGAKVTKINQDGDRVTGVEYLERRTNSSRRIDGVTDVVVAAGPWTGVVLPRTKVEGLRAHSVVWNAHVSPYAVFTDIELPDDYVPEHRRKLGQGRKHTGNVDPEIYARPGGEVYACGEPDSTVPLPPTADMVQCDEAQCDDLVAYVATVSPALAAAPVKKKQACYLPRHMRLGDEKAPLVGRTSTRGLWVASGHTCWGVQNGPGTGCLMAEMLLDGEARSANVDKLDPRRYKV